MNASSQKETFGPEEAKRPHNWVKDEAHKKKKKKREQKLKHMLYL